MKSTAPAGFAEKPLNMLELTNRVHTDRLVAERNPGVPKKHNNISAVDEACAYY